MQLHVGYVLKMFPRLSETFILNEILELERQGVQVTVYSLMYPADGRFHGSLAGLRQAVEYVPRDKPEGYWESLHGGTSSIDLSRLQPAVEFLRRRGIPKDLDLVLRSALIAQLARRAGVQHLHAHFATVATRVAACAQMIGGLPFSFTSHAKDIFRHTVDRALYAELAEEAAFNITVSDDNREFLLRSTPGLSPEKVHRLYNGIDLEQFQPRADPRGAGVPHVVSIGRMVPKKGFDVLLEALALWKADGCSFRCSIVGDGELEGALRGRCRSLGLDPEVRFLGALPQEEIRRLLNEASLVALACRRDEDGNQDALPTVLLEALAMDVPVVSTRVGGVPEIVGEDAGQVVEPEDPEALAAAMAALGSDPAARPAAGRCRARAEERFDLRRNIALLRERFEASATQGPPA